MLETIAAPWDLFNRSYRAKMPVACNRVMLCGAGLNDSKLSINMALTQASVDGAAAAVCVDTTPDSSHAARRNPARRQVVLPDDLAAIGFSIAQDTRGLWPATTAGNEMVNAAVLAVLRADRASPAPVLSNSTVGINRGTLYGTREYGYDYFVSNRMVRTSGGRRPLLRTRTRTATVAVPTCEREREREI